MPKALRDAGLPRSARAACRSSRRRCTATIASLSFDDGLPVPLDEDGHDGSLGGMVPLATVIFGAAPWAPSTVGQVRRQVGDGGGVVAVRGVLAVGRDHVDDEDQRVGALDAGLRVALRCRSRPSAGMTISTRLPALMPTSVLTQPVMTSPVADRGRPPGGRGRRSCRRPCLVA